MCTVERNALAMQATEQCMNMYSGENLLKYLQAREQCAYAVHSGEKCTYRAGL